ELSRLNRAARNYQKNRVIRLARLVRQLGAAAPTSTASVRFYLLSGGLPTISCGGWSCRIGDHRRCLNVLAAPRDDVHPGTSETSRRSPLTRVKAVVRPSVPR